MSLLNSVQAKLSSLKNISANATSIITTPAISGTGSAQQRSTFVTVRLMRPNFSRIDTWQQTASKDGHWTKQPMETSVGDTDGTKAWQWTSYNNQYQVSAAPTNGRDIEPGADILRSFFNSDASLVMQVRGDKEIGIFQSLRYLGIRQWMGNPYKVVELTEAPHLTLPDSLASKVPNGKIIVKSDYYIGSDLFIHRSVQNYNFGYSRETQLTDLAGDSSLDQVAFKFDIPKGATLAPPPPALIGRGEAMPDFTVQDVAGKPVHLSDYFGKVVVVDFWATWCGPCQSSLPHTNAVAAKFRSKNVEVLGINTWDTADKFKEWLPKHKSYSAIDFVIDPGDQNSNIASNQLGVSGIPTQFVVDAAGNITNTFVGYGGPSSDLSNAIKAAIAAVPSGPHAYAGPEQYTALPKGTITLAGKYAGASTTSPQQQIHAALYSTLAAPTTTITWSKVSGPGNVTFSNPNFLQTTAAFDTPGDYTLSLDVTAGGVSSSSITRVLVAPANVVSLMPTTALEANNDTDQSNLVWKYARVNHDTKNKAYSDAYFQFSLSGVSSVSNARLIIYGGVPYDGHSLLPVTIGVHELSSTGWDAASAWTAKPIYGDEIGTLSSVPVLANSTQRYYSIDVTKYVSDQLASKSKSVSFALTSETAQINEPFYASDVKGTTDEPGTRLVIQP
jgi:thiol-disulfide isomerase/thioredoxin